MRSLTDPDAPGEQLNGLQMGRVPEFVSARWSEIVGACPCCGNRSRVVWGGISSASGIEAAYFVHWTEGPAHAAHIDLIDGAWGPGAQPGARTIVTLRYEIGTHGGKLVPIDSATRLAASPAICCRALGAGELAGSEQADRIQAAIAAVWMSEPMVADLIAHNSASFPSMPCHTTAQKC